MTGHDGTELFQAWPDMTTESDALSRLAPLLGEWRMETSLPGAGAVPARTTFEWGLGGAFLIQRAEIELPEAPDALCVIAVDPTGSGFTQHWFDSRGIVRLYAMTFDDGLWTLSREAPDFTPLEFAQRFAGRVEDDGSTIRGRWEKKHPGQDWQTDFDVTYVKLR